MCRNAFTFIKYVLLLQQALRFVWKTSTGSRTELKLELVRRTTKRMNLKLIINVKSNASTLNVHMNITHWEEMSAK